MRASKAGAIILGTVSGIRRKRHQQREVWNVLDHLFPWEVIQHILYDYTCWIISSGLWVVIVTTPRGNMGFPKGHVEQKDKTVDAGAWREVYEECGLDFRNLNYDSSLATWLIETRKLPSRGRSRPRPLPINDVQYRVVVIFQPFRGQALKCQDTNELTHVKWMSVDRILFSSTSRFKIERKLLLLKTLQLLCFAWPVSVSHKLHIY